MYACMHTYRLTLASFVWKIYRVYIDTHRWLYQIYNWVCSMQCFILEHIYLFLFILYLYLYSIYITAQATPKSHVGLIFLAPRYGPFTKTWHLPSQCRALLGRLRLAAGWFDFYKGFIQGSLNGTHLNLGRDQTSSKSMVILGEFPEFIMCISLGW